MMFQTTHNLKFEVAKYWFTNEWLQFRIGTCHGLWRSTETAYQILAVLNSKPGNGHFDDVIEWFEASCIRDKKQLEVLEIWNRRLLQHLLEKRGFTLKDNDIAIKCFDVKGRKVE